MNCPRITPTEAARWMEEAGAIYLDVRTVEEFELGHPNGAFNLPWELRAPPGANPAFVNLACKHFDRAQALIVGCHTGKRSTPACAALAEAGFTNIREQSAGYAGCRDAFGRLVEPGWERAGLPTSCQAFPGRSYAEL